MIGLANLKTEHHCPQIFGTSSRKSKRRSYIVRQWSAEKCDLPVFDYLKGKRIKVAPEECLTIVNAVGDCFYAAIFWFDSRPVDSDEWASAAWKFLFARARKIATSKVRA